MKIRTVFGLVALREKLLCADLELDDIALELLKFRLMQVPGGFVLDKDQSPRLIGSNEKQLIFIGVVSREERSRESEVLAVDRKAYQEIVNEMERWEAIAHQFCQGSYVDLGRIFKFQEIETNSVVEKNPVSSAHL